jgi:outer membrane lipoprotein-sorting protein
MLCKKILNFSMLTCLCFSPALMAADSPPSDGKTVVGNSPASRPAVSKPSVPKLTAEQVIEKNVAARGGLQGWRAVQAMVWTGKMDAGSGDSVTRSTRFAQAGLIPNSRKPAHAKEVIAAQQAGLLKTEAEKQVQLPFVLDMKRSHKSRLQIEFAGKTAVQVYDGTHGWKLRPFLNRNDVEPFTEDEAKAEAGKPDMDGPLVDYASKGTKVALESVEPVEGHDAYKLKLTMKNGDVQHVWIDAQSFLDVKIEASPRRMDGKMHTVVVYQRDFRSVDGLMVPFVLETAVDGYPNTHKIYIEKVAVNPKLDDSLFAKPGA